MIETSRNVWDYVLGYFIFYFCSSILFGHSVLCNNMLIQLLVSISILLTCWTHLYLIAKKEVFEPIERIGSATVLVVFVSLDL